MTALHLVETKAIENIENSPALKLEHAYSKLTHYLEEVKTTRHTKDFVMHEEAVTRMVYEMGQAALSDVLNHYDIHTEVISVGEQTYRQAYQGPKEYQTALGPVKIERHMYSNRKSDGDGQCICPLELQSGIIEGYWTPMAAKNALWALAHLTAGETEEMLLQFGGMNPSRSTLDRLPKIMNQQWEPQSMENYQQLIAEETIPKEAVSFSTSLDGVMIGMKPEKSTTKEKKSMKTEWREASCGTLSFFDAKGERLSTLQYGQMPEHKKVTLKTLIQKNTEEILRQRPDLKLVHLADGARDNWTFFDEQMPLGFQLTDFYHATEYLSDAFNAAYPTDKAKSREKYRYYKTLLRDEVGGVNKTLRALRYLRDQHKNNTIIADAVTYFTNNQHRMNYATAKANHFPIGSGVVEAACKTLVGQRLKRAGMSWYQNGGQGVLTCRSLIKSHRFDKAWKFIAEPYKKDITIHKNVISLVVQNLA
jgi:hypothetical protein